MTIKKVKTGWQVNIQPGGRGSKRLKKTLPTKAEAMAWETHIRAKVQQNPEWVPPKKDTRKLSELVELWYQHHGATLRAGEDTKRRLLFMCEAMKDPRADQFSADVFAEYRRKRLEAGVTASNMNREHAYLRACFNELTRLNHWKRDNPMKHIRAIKVQELALTYLTAEQIPKLLNELTKSRNPHAYLIAKTCLCTGARWGEVEDLRVSQIRNQQITFARTKTGPARSVPIAPELEDQLHSHHTTHGIEDRLFAAASGAFREGVERMGLTLPDGQMTHVLRHTFASHFMMNGGNICQRPADRSHFRIGV